MKLKTLIRHAGKGLILKGSSNPEITGITSHSKKVGFGNLFIAKKGLSHDGSAFIEEAMAAGAAAVLTDLYNPFLKKEIVQLITSDIVGMEAHLAKTFFDAPDAKLFIVGITGTNGKTTTAYLIHHILESLQIPCGLIGTVEWRVGSHIFPPSHTTPDLLTCYKLFSDMVQAGSQAAAIEISSHALDQKRIKNLDIDVAVFTNLTQDHLDYHQSMDSYAAAKAKLFSEEYFSKKNQGGFAIVNKDSPYFETMTQNTPRTVLSYGIEEIADLQAQEVKLNEEGLAFTLLYQGEKFQLQSQLSGRFNVYNILAAMGACLVKKIPLPQVIQAIKTFKTVPGRLERVPNKRGLHIFVDYAHTDNALENVLKTLQEFKRGKVITVFGCGGDRDALKRPKMGRVAEEFSDQIIITSDNPRHEDPSKIIQEIVTGLKNPEKALIHPDRSTAIQEAIGHAKAGDTILIAGKGHENYQIFAHQTLSFDDKEEVVKALRATLG